MRKGKARRYIIFILLYSLFIFLNLSASKVKASLNTSNVDDKAGLLTPSTKRKIEIINSNKLSKVKGHPQIAVLTVNSIGDRDIADYAQDKFEEYGIGNSSKDNGVLIIIAKKQGKIRVQTGYGMEEILPDIYLDALIDQVFNKHISSSRGASSDITGNGGKSDGGGADRRIAIVENDTTSSLVSKLVTKLSKRIISKSSLKIEDKGQNTPDSSDTTSMQEFMENSKRKAIVVVIATPIAIIFGIFLGRVIINSERNKNVASVAYVDTRQNKGRHQEWKKFSLELNKLDAYISYYDYYHFFYGKYGQAHNSMLLDAAVWNLLKKKRNTQSTANENSKELDEFLKCIDYQMGVKPKFEGKTISELKTIIYKIRKQYKAFVRKTD